MNDIYVNISLPLWVGTYYYYYFFINFFFLLLMIMLTI